MVRAPVPRRALLLLGAALAALSGCPEERPEAEKLIPAERVPPAVSIDPPPSPRRSPAFHPFPRAKPGASTAAPPAEDAAALAEHAGTSAQPGASAVEGGAPPAELPGDDAGPDTGEPRPSSRKSQLARP